MTCMHIATPYPAATAAVASAAADGLYSVVVSKALGRLIFLSTLLRSDDNTSEVVVVVVAECGTEPDEDLGATL